MTTPSRITATYTVAAMEVPKDFYCLVKSKLRAAGYDESIKDDMIDMHGIALVAAEASPSDQERRLAWAREYLGGPHPMAPDEPLRQEVTQFQDLVDAMEAEAAYHRALTWRDVPPRPAYASPQNTRAGDRVRPDHHSDYGPIEKIEGGWMFVRMPDGQLVQTDLAAWEDGAA